MPKIITFAAFNKDFFVFSRFYPSPYSIATNRMITQTSITPYIASPVSTYQVCMLSSTVKMFLKTDGYLLVTTCFYWFHKV